MKTLDDLFKIVKPTHPEFVAAETKAKSLTERASLNEAIKVITDLEENARSMHISNRFSTTKEPNFDFSHGMVNPSLKGLSEAEYKRQTILLSLMKLKGEIALLVGNIEDIVMDMEATKIDDVIPEQGSSK